MGPGLSTERLRRIDRFFQEKYIDTGKLPGAQILVARRGEIAHFSSLGYMDVEHDKPTAEDTIYRIYSMTKAITTVALMMLYEEGQFQLNDPVYKYLPEWENTEVWESGESPDFKTRPQERAMTIHDLLTHQSGLTYGFNDTNAVDRAYQQIGAEEMYSIPLDKWSKRLAELPLLFSPGTAWNYSLATDVCGYLVQVISGQNFDDFLDARILGPLDMADTSFTISDDKIDRFATCYEPTPEGGIKVQDAAETSNYRKQMNFISGGAGLISTTMDYYRFLYMLANVGVADGRRYLSRKTIELMTMNHLPDGRSIWDHNIQPLSDETHRQGAGFGLGFAINLDSVKSQIVGAPGQYTWAGMASTEYWVDPAEEVVVIFMTQLLPSGTYPIKRELQVLVNAAIDD
jgi:CubicO group peptidase (beta-lactamase class C family)